jgi:hypothetical protein
LGGHGRQIPFTGNPAAEFLCLVVILMLIGQVRNLISGHPDGPGQFS